MSRLLKSQGFPDATASGRRFCKAAGGISSRARGSGSRAGATGKAGGGAGGKKGALFFLSALVVIVAFSIGAIMSRRLLRRLSARLQPDKRPLAELAGETVFYVVIAVGSITGLGPMGIDVPALIAGLGLTGFALGFTMRDALSNLIAGVLVLLYQPFNYGDKITVAGNKGKVIGINFRYTVLEAESGTVVHVPNSTTFNNSVTVETGTSEMPSR